jgi:hypothetical protein
MVIAIAADSALIGKPKGGDECNINDQHKEDCMNIERFNSIMYDIANDEQELKLSSLLKTLQNTFSQNINQPNEATSNAFKNARQVLWEALAKCRSNKFPPSQKAFIDYIDATKFLGAGLKTELERIIADNASTPGQAVVEVQKHVTDTLEFVYRVTTVNKTLVDLKIEYDFTAKDEYEIGILFPTTLFNNNLEGLQKELCKLNQYMKVFGEIAADDTSSPTIRSITNGSADFFLNTVPAVAAFLALAIDKIVGLYLRILQIRKLRQDMKNTKVPEKLLKPIEDHEKVLISEEIEKIAKDLFKEYRKKPNKNRDPELQIHLTNALVYLIKRLDQGVDFEINPPTEFEEPKEDASEKDKKDYEKKVAEAKELSDRSAKIKELPTRDKPALYLPEPDYEEETKESLDQKK